MIPSPPQGVWEIGPFPLRAYALWIIVGIIVAIWWGEKRWVARGGRAGVVVDTALWAIPFGLIGGRIYHVATDWYRYFGEGRNPVDALKIWDGGLGIWGAVAFGALGALIGLRTLGIRSVGAFADSIAPPIILAQGIGRLGNYFNQELYGGETDLPWGLEIYRRYNEATGDYGQYQGTSTGEVLTVVHPTFLYELVWCVLVAVILVALDRKFRLGHGHVFALYVALYCLGRFGIELMRTDDATMVFGLRINTIVSAVVLLVALAYVAFKKPRHREDPNELLPKNQSGMTSEEPDRDEAVATGSAGHETGSAAEDRPERPGDGRE